MPKAKELLRFLRNHGYEEARQRVRIEFSPIQSDPCLVCRSIRATFHADCSCASLRTQASQKKTSWGSKGRN